MKSMKLRSVALMGLLLGFVAVEQGVATPDPVEIGHHEVTFVTVRYDYPQPGQSTWYYTVESGRSPSISHVVFEMLCPTIQILDAGTWDGQDPDSRLSGAGEPEPGSFPAAPINNPPTGGTRGLKFDQGFNDNEIRHYYFTVDANYDAEPTTVVAKAGPEDTSGQVIGPSASCDVIEPDHPAIDLVKSADPQTYAAAGDVIAYSFTVRNTGNVTLTDVSVSDPTLGLVALAISPATLVPDQTGTATATYTVTQADVDAGRVDNTATATGQDPNGEPVSDSVVDWVVFVALPAILSLWFKKQALTPTYSQVGDVITYRFSVRNTGDVTLTDVRIDDPILGIADLPVSPSTLQPDWTGVVEANYTVTQADVDAGRIDNVATAKGTPPTGPDVTDTDDETVLYEPPPVEEDVTRTLTKVELPIPDYRVKWSIPLSKGQQFTDGDYWLRLEQDGPSFDVWGPGDLKSGVLISKHWHHVVGRFTRGPEAGGDHLMEILVDGELVASKTGRGVPRPSAAPLLLGSYLGNSGFYAGLMDEVRLSSVARSDAWLRTTWVQQRDPAAFLALGEEEPGSRAGYAYRRSLTVDGALVDGELTDFPVLVKLNESFLVNGVLQADGSDLVFTLPDGTVLAHEVELFDAAAGRLAAWVKLPLVVSGAPTLFYVQYGNAAPPPPVYPASAVWDGAFVMVQHLNETGGSTVYDSTVFGNDGTVMGGAIPTVYGSVNGAYAFNGSDAMIEVPDDPSLHLNLGDFTMEVWLARKAVGADALFEITVYNEGPDAAVGVVVSDELAPDFTYVDAWPSQGAYDAASGLWTVGDLAAGESATLRLGADFVREGPLTNRAAVVSAHAGDPLATEVVVQGYWLPPDPGVGNPDFRVTEIVFDPPAPGPGEAFAVTVTVDNPTGRTGNAGYLAFWRHKPSAAVPGEPGEVERWVGPLGGGEVRAITVDGFTAPEAPGTYRFRAYIDSRDDTLETSEGNNQKMLTYHITTDPDPDDPDPDPDPGDPDPDPEPADWRKADFAITAMACVDPEEPVKGEGFRLRVWIENRGDVAGDGGHVYFWAAAPYEPELAVLSEPVGVLEPGQATTRSRVLQAPQQAGSYTARALIVTDTPEKSTGNNHKTFSYRLAGEAAWRKPDFVVSEMLLTPLPGSPEDEFEAVVTVLNQGDVAGDAGVLRIWAAKASAAVGEAGDDEVALGVLEPQESVTRVFGLRAPQQAGTYHARAFVDADNVTEEKSEGNNQKSVAYSIYDFRLRVKSLPGGMELTWNSRGNWTYTVERSTNLVAGFEVLAADLPATPPQNTYLDADASSSGAYYRVRRGE